MTQAPIFKEHADYPTQSILLGCGIAAALVYVLTDVTAALSYRGYSVEDQAVSELFAIGAPTSSLVVPLFTLSSALLLAFAAGVTRSGQTRSRRLLGFVFAGSAGVGLILWTFFPMHMRGSVPTFTDTMHLILASNPFVFLTLVIGAITFRGWFRIVSMGTLVVVIGLATFAFHYAPALANGQPTPGLGLTERAAQYAYEAWQVTLAFLLLDQRRTVAAVT